MPIFAWGKYGMESLKMQELKKVVFEFLTDGVSG